VQSLLQKDVEKPFSFPIEQLEIYYIHLISAHIPQKG
jgi:hypothetical protein